MNQNPVGGKESKRNESQPFENWMRTGKERDGVATQDYEDQKDF